MSVPDFCQMIAMSKGFTYLLTRLRGTELLVGSEAQTIDEIKSLLVERKRPVSVLQA